MSFWLMIKQVNITTSAIFFLVSFTPFVADYTQKQWIKKWNAKL